MEGTSLRFEYLNNETILPIRFAAIPLTISKPLNLNGPGSHVRGG